MSLSVAMLICGVLVDGDFTYTNETTVITHNHPEEKYEQKQAEEPILEISEIYEINDDYLGSSEGDGDGLIDAGETVELRLQLENVGNQTATNIYGNLTTVNDNVKLNSWNQSFLQIAAGDKGLSVSYFIIEFNSKLAEDDEIAFTLDINAIEGYWSDTFILQVNGVPLPEYYGHIVTYEFDGDLNADNDAIIDPGERCYVDFYVKNSGTSHLFNVDGYLNTTDVYVSLIDDDGVFGTVDGSGGLEYGSFAFEISGGCPEGHLIPFYLSLEDQLGNFWNKSIELEVSGAPEYQLEKVTFIEYEGDYDNVADAGEVWYVDIAITNVGTAVGPNVMVSLITKDEKISYYYDYENRAVSFEDINAGFQESKNSSYRWNFIISDSATVGEKLELGILIEDDFSTTVTNFTTEIEVMGVTEYNLTNFQIIKSCYAGSNCDDVIAAGDTFYANISIMNIGNAIGNDIEVYLYSGDKYVDFNYGNGSYYYFGTILVNETVFYDYYQWQIDLSKRAKAGHEITFTIVIKDKSLREWSFSRTITVEDGPNTFIHTREGIMYIVIGFLIFIVFFVAPPVIRKVKGKEGWTLGSNLKDWWEEKKTRRKDKREQRKKERAQKQREKEARRQQEERERIATINANEKKLLEKFEAILEMTDRVNIKKVAKSLALSETQLFEKLILWEDKLPFKIDGDYIEVDDLDDFSESMRQKIAETEKYYSCFYCGFPVERTSKVCPECKKPIEKCAVCKLPISFGDDIGKCSLCEAKGHLSHMQEWVKTQGKCPVCLQKLPIEGIVPIIVENGKKKNK
jgi:hypothetical protein